MDRKRSTPLPPFACPFCGKTALTEGFKATLSEVKPNYWLCVCFLCGAFYIEARRET